MLNQVHMTGFVNRDTKLVSFLANTKLERHPELDSGSLRKYVLGNLFQNLFNEVV